jgi:serine/threonine protein kinase
MAWMLAVRRSSGPEMASVYRHMGQQLAELGLPAVGSLAIVRASNAYRQQVRDLTAGRQSHGQIVQTRVKMAECEFDLARIFLERGNLERATYHFARARDGAPEVETTSRCWEAYIDGLQDEPGAKSRLLDIYVDNARDPLPTYLVGLLFLQDGKAEEGRRYLEKSLEAPDGDTYETRLALAKACDSAGDQPAAIEHATASLRLARTAGEKHQAAVLLGRTGGDHPSPPIAWLSAFVQQHRSGLVGSLVLVLALFYPTFLGWGGRLAPSVAVWLYLLARSSEPSAVQVYEAALKRWPNNVRLLRALARAYCRVGVGTSRAAELYERLWVLQPDDQEALSQAARLGLECGRDNEEALLACQTWFEANPEHPQALAVASHLARACRKRGVSAPASALPALQLAVEAAPTDYDLRRYLGAMYCHYGLHREAAEALEPILSADPSDLGIRKEYAHALIGLGDAYTAYRHLSTLPPSAEVTTDLYLAGTVAQKEGRYRESLRILQEVVRRDPSLFDVQERIAAAAARADESRCGPMEIVETLAAHEASVVYRAQHPDHGEVLLLSIRRDFSDNVDFPARFRSRMEQLQTLRGSVAEVLEYGADEQAYYVVYRIPAGRQLSRLIESDAPLTAARADGVMTGLLSALQELHDSGEVHGDMRPSAVWLSDEGQAVLLGAGIPQIAEAGQQSGPPGPRSPFYVAPEVVQQGSVTASADVYSAGCILYELLVGAPPFGGPTHLATMMAHVTVEPEPPSMRVPGIPRAMDELVAAALAKDPEERFASAQEFLEALRSPAQVAGSEEESEEAELQPAAAQAATAVDDGTQAAPAQAAAASGVMLPPDPNRWWTFYQSTALMAPARFAKVYRGIHRQTGETHAIKHLQTLRPLAVGSAAELAPSTAEGARRLFLGEMHVLQALSEEGEPIPGIVPMVQAYRADERNLAYAMPFLNGTLGQRIERMGPMPMRTAFGTIVAVADALAQLHERQIVHRNVSPNSVMFGDEDELRLVGFDRACHLSDRGPMLLIERELHTGAASPLHVLGDVRFLSPEQCRGEDFDQRTDIYALGCLLFFVLAGRAPFSRSDPMQTMMDHVSAEVPRLRDAEVDVPADIQSIIERALAKSPGDRYASVTEIREAIAVQVR